MRTVSHHLSQHGKPSVTDFKFHDVNLLNSKLQEEALIRHLHMINTQKRHSSVCLFRAAQPRFLFLLVVVVAVVLYVCFNLSISLSQLKMTTAPSRYLILAFLPFSFLFYTPAQLQKEGLAVLNPQQPIRAPIKALITNTPFPSPTPPLLRPVRSILRKKE